MSAATWVEYAADSPGWRGTWPEPGDRGCVLTDNGDRLLVRWRLRATGEEREVWTMPENVRAMERGS